MQTIVMYVSAAETLGVVRDSANAKNVASPTFVLACPVMLKMRLFPGLNNTDPYPLAEFANVDSWTFVMDSDFTSTTAYKLAVTGGITVYQQITVNFDAEVPDASGNSGLRVRVGTAWTSGTKIATAVVGEIWASNGTAWTRIAETSEEEMDAFTEVSIPITDMNTQELIAWLSNVESKTGLHGELVGFDLSDEQIFVLQVKNFTVRNRIYHG